MTVTSDSPSAGVFDTLIDGLSLERKVTLLTGHTAFTMAPEPSIGLGEIALSDGPTGVRGLTFTGGRQVSLFPNATLLASAWSEESAELVGGLLAQEAMAQEIHVVLGPTINLHRSLLGGRLFEAYSEDPLLTGKLAAAYVRGLQRHSVGACLKHLVANESETLRNSMNSKLDEATLRELYLLPFEIAVHESQPWSIMAAYNDVNGVAATEQDHVINRILKGEWHFDGLVMSDWFATKTAAPAAGGGLDLVMPGPAGPWGEVLVAAVRAGEVDESVIDDHLRRILVLADRVGALGPLRAFPTDLPAPDSSTRREQLTRLAADGITVLTNSGVLPLAGSTSVALIGPPRHRDDRHGRRLRAGEPAVPGERGTGAARPARGSAHRHRRGRGPHPPGGGTSRIRHRPPQRCTRCPGHPPGRRQRHVDGVRHTGRHGRIRRRAAQTRCHGGLPGADHRTRTRRARFPRTRPVGARGR